MLAIMVFLRYIKIWQVGIVIVLLAVAVALTACGTDEVGPTGFEPTQPTGRFRFVHAMSDPPRASAVNVAVDGVPVAASACNIGSSASSP